MNQKNAHLYLPHVQAFADGKLQVLYNGKWFDWNTPDLTFDLPPDHYRRKPKPRVYWLVFDAVGEVCWIFPTETEALGCVRRFEEYSAVKFVEDIDSGKKEG